MKKMLLLVAFSTVRDDERVNFQAGSVQGLTSEEIENFDILTKKTGKLHYREPINEGSGEKIGLVVAGDDFVGESVAMDKKTVVMLEAYLDYNKVDRTGAIDKPGLLALAQSHAKDGDL